jgi:pilus assembly protein Flp/PilA
MRIQEMMRKFSEDEAGATAIEYGLIASLIVIALIASMNTFGEASEGLWATVTSNVSAVM